MINRNVLTLTASLLALTVAKPGLAAEWLLLSHEGGCATLNALDRKLPNLPTIQTPDEFEVYLKTAGLEYSRKVHSGGGGNFNEFHVPSAGLSVVLVPRAQCQEVLLGPR